MGINVRNSHNEGERERDIQSGRKEGIYETVWYLI